MMKKALFTLALVGSFAVVYSVKDNEICKPKPIIKANKAAMKPYRLDTYTDQEIVFGKTSKNYEVPFTAYSGEHYKIMFASENHPQEFSVGIYNRNKKAKTRSELYKGTFKDGVNTLEPFEVKKPGNYYIEIQVPASSDSGVTKKGCIITMFGFKELE